MIVPLELSLVQRYYRQVRCSCDHTQTHRHPTVISAYHSHRPVHYTSQQPSRFTGPRWPRAMKRHLSQPSLREPVTSARLTARLTARRRTSARFYGLNAPISDRRSATLANARASPRRNQPVRRCAPICAVTSPSDATGTSTTGLSTIGGDAESRTTSVAESFPNEIPRELSGHSACQTRRRFRTNLHAE